MLRALRSGSSAPATRPCSAILRMRRDHPVPRGPGQEPGEQVERPAAGRDEAARQHRVGEQGRPRAVPRRPRAVPPRAPPGRPGQRGEAGRVREQREREPAARARQARGERQVGIVRPLGEPVVLMVPAAVRAQILAQRRGTEPGADPRVGGAAREEEPVRRLVHEHDQPELPRADDHHRHAERPGRRPERVEGDRPRDRRPRVEHQRRRAGWRCDGTGRAPPA